MPVSTAKEVQDPPKSLLVQKYTLPMPRCLEIYQRLNLVYDTALEVKAVRLHAKRTYSLEVAFYDFSRGSVDRNGKDSNDDGQEFSREHRCAGVGEEWKV